MDHLSSVAVIGSGKGRGESIMQYKHEHRGTHDAGCGSRVSKEQCPQPIVSLKDADRLSEYFQKVMAIKQTHT